MDLRSLSPELRSKLKEVQILAGRATRQETQGNYEQAFFLYVDSVQKYLHLIPLIQDAALKDQLKAISSKLLNRAERIKSSRPHLRLRAPVRDRTSSEEQEAVLRRSQKINGLNFHPWPSLDLGPTVGPSQQPQSLVSKRIRLASVQPALNPVQKQAFLEWRSITEASPGLPVYDPHALEPTDIVQDVVTDCSLIAAFSVLINHAKRFQSKLHTECLYPKGPDGFPVASEDGIYRVKLFLNGVEREVVVDDKVPISSSGSPMCAKSRRGLFFWPSLVEKAVSLHPSRKRVSLNKKEFPWLNIPRAVHEGDGWIRFCWINPHIDPKRSHHLSSALTGWIPETILLTRYADITKALQDYRSERSWNRVYSGFSQGHPGRCLVSVGTNANNLDALENVGLVPLHDYAVIARAIDWSRSIMPGMWLNHGLHPRLNGRLSWGTPCLKLRPLVDDRSGWERLLSLGNLSRCTSRRFISTGILLHSNSNILSICLTFSLKFDHGPVLDASHDEVWIFLTRHLDSQATDNRRFASLQVFLDDQEQKTPAQQSYDSLTHGPPPLTATSLSNSTHLIARFSLTDTRARYLINFSFHDDLEPKPQTEGSSPISKSIGFTLQVLSPVAMSLTDSSPVPLPFSKEVEGQWSPKTSGGNHALASYSNNPMWRITIEEGTQGATRDESARAWTPVNLSTSNLFDLAVMGDSVERRDVVTDSGSYTLGRAQLHANGLLAGKYTIVPSTYQAGVIGLFKLRLECDLPLTRVESIPSEGAGMYKRVGSLSWEEDRQGGGVWRLTGGKGLVKCKIKLQAAQQPCGYPIKLSLVAHPSSREYKEGEVISPGVFTNALSGAALGPLQLSFPSPLDHYTIGIEALGDSCVAKGQGYVLTVYADQPLCLERITLRKSTQ
ncbi:calpain-like protease palB/RIM13 [Puccinia sorghi]|uniref:Calpain-like protease palB/RIM13 n=1 Tax=Puccinia sorghi TaxID=27349 RepID=A0A0L6VW28_9BASI|nr:calpain-like protease palB/RIM13 [Puccinia sorghi]